MLIVLLSFSRSLATKCMFLNNEQIDLKNYKRDCITVSLNKCDGNCNTFNDLSDRVCVPNKTDDVDLNVFNMITSINEAKTLKNMFHVVVM